MKYLYLQSSMHKDPSLREKAADVFRCVNEKTGILFTEGTLEEVKKEPASIVYVSTGGTAGIFKDALPLLPEPIIIITTGSDNSLSASMEMMTYLVDINKKSRLLHGSNEEISITLDILLRAITAKDSMKGLRLGLLGKPSQWLISTSCDYNILKEKLGIEVIDIDMAELLEEIGKKSYPDNEYCRSLMEQDFDKDQIKGALEIYGGFSRLVDKYQLNGFSVRCFDLLSAVNNSGCLGLALLNQQGIYSGCEADLPSLVSMAILGRISGKPVFQCNPSRINKEANEIIFAHCTLPLNMPVRYKLDTHFESGIGVAIAGDIPSGQATIFKTNSTLGRHFISGGLIKESLHECNLCRSQIKVSCDAGVNNFLHTPVGNHYLICLGDYSESINEFFALI